MRQTLFLYGHTVRIDGPYRIVHVDDTDYVVGNGICFFAESAEQAAELIAKLRREHEISTISMKH